MKEFDTSYALPRGRPLPRQHLPPARQFGVVMRVIPPKIGTFEQLNLPDVLGEIVQAPTGLVLVTGPTGNGKSTTIASMIQFLNENLRLQHPHHRGPDRVPLHLEKSCVIQREVGIDTESFSAGIKSAMRMDPDVIMVGEMRDRETIDACVKAAETGHLVFSTLHTQARSRRSTASSGTTRPTRRRSSASGSPTSSWPRSRCA